METKANDRSLRFMAQSPFRSKNAGSSEYGPYSSATSSNNYLPTSRNSEGEKSANNRRLQPPHSITSSARASSVGGTESPSFFAVLRLTTSSYLVGACTGRSAGLSPLRM